MRIIYCNLILIRDHLSYFYPQGKLPVILLKLTYLKKEIVLLKC